MRWVSSMVWDFFFTGQSELSGIPPSSSVMQLQLWSFTDLQTSSAQEVIVKVSTNYPCSKTVTDGACSTCMMVTFVRQQMLSQPALFQHPLSASILLIKKSWSPGSYSLVHTHATAKVTPGQSIYSSSKVKQRFKQRTDIQTSANDVCKTSTGGKPFHWSASVQHAISLLVLCMVWNAHEILARCV